jgi:hypothetical protein
MKITIVGSMKFYPEYQQLKKKLEALGHKVIIPLPDEFYNKNSQTKLDAMKDFNKNLEWSEAILVANYKKDNIENYIGINSVMEVGMAFNRKKKIFILFSIPETCYKEFKSIGVIELNNDLAGIK